MMKRTAKLRWRRRFRRSRQHIETISEQAEQRLEEHIISRLGRVWMVRRFLMAWLLLIGILSGLLIVQTRGLSQYYQAPGPVPGGTYTEGILGTFTNANPLYATGPVDGAVSRLIFAGLFKYNEANQLVGDLAEKWQVNERENVYTVTLRDKLSWHDGRPVTAEDVVFTYDIIQNPDAKSPLATSWRGVKVAVVDAKTITFTLPQALSAFPYSLTNGIVPKHWLGGLPPTQLRSVTFNTANPVGAGPFVWKTAEVIGSTPEDREVRIGLVPFDNYVGGKPKLDRFVVRAFRNEQAMLSSFRKRELNGAAGLTTVPAELTQYSSNFRAYHFQLTGATMAFFKNTNEILADVRVRKALIHATNTDALPSKIGHPVKEVHSPLLKSHIGYDPALTQLPHDVAAANRLLDEAGWIMGEGGVRTKDGRPLTIQLFTENSAEYIAASDYLRDQWQAVGVDVQVQRLAATDLQAIIREHTYDVLLYSISLGADPDVFAYWHSTQADIRAASRLNFSEYTSGAADRALEAGRTRSDVSLRAVKYRPFLEAWRNDAPALGLYQPQFLYVSRQTVHGLTEHPINTGIDRFNTVENWMIREKPQDMVAP